MPSGLCEPSALVCTPCVPAELCSYRSGFVQEDFASSLQGSIRTPQRRPRRCRAHHSYGSDDRLPHPFQVDDVTQRVQCHTGPVPRQLCYLLPFRVQVCRVQCPLPCFPSTVLFCDVSLLSTGSHRSGSPASPILRRRYAILHCIPVAYGFASSSRVSLSRFVYRLRAPVRPEEVFSGFDAGVPHSGFSHADRTGLLRFLGSPSHTSAMLQDPGRIEQTSPCGLLDAAPAPNKTKAPAVT